MATAAAATSAPAKEPARASSKNNTGTASSASEVPDGNKLADGMKELAVSSTAISAASTPSLVVNGSTSSPSPAKSQGKADHSTPVSDDHSQRADSNSEMETKPPSLDGKSITSGTTFALDEKESLRPDDSASVKGGAEEEEGFSVKGPQAPRMSERVHRLRIGDMPERRIVQILPESVDQGVMTPQSGASSQQPPPDAPQSIPQSAAALEYPSVYGKNPDDKLLEAMQSPKDRLFLLRLEQDVVNFVQSSK